VLKREHYGREGLGEKGQKKVSGSNSQLTYYAAKLQNDSADQVRRYELPKVQKSINNMLKDAHDGKAPVVEVAKDWQKNVDDMAI